MQTTTCFGSMGYGGSWTSAEQTAQAASIRGCWVDGLGAWGCGMKIDRGGSERWMCAPLWLVLSRHCTCGAGWRDTPCRASPSHLSAES
ncbi:uncharacterized protein B0H18DRAFT_966094 [Fomitopsis serialis]|uniref:uncharacterized protein n=1 Tax=Fomitopsis serialis TaxID=139415 RepID=UPI002007FEFF|nr:uncharacterized protein B0H18DRAFT_966094 [Neoantrodia serialis]KAH9938208.1 hypothetical protein B0H18DRAFT_966094 [Neoantrodia serialis]